jgi:ubiquinone/menaquinone biosynthesis C-methylase UbiE
MNHPDPSPRAATLEALHQTFEDGSLFEGWDDRYYYPEAVRFYDLAFDFIMKALDARPGERVLDAGCGPARHSMYFARRGVETLAIDLSEAVLNQAQARVRAAGLETRIRFQREDLTTLSFRDDTFGRAFSWGVLMHVPDVAQALRELARVLKPGGRIAISLLNPRSVDAALMATARWWRHRRTGGRGEGNWVQDTTGPIYVKGIPPRVFSRMVADAGLRVVEVRSGQFTEFKAPAGLLRRLVGRFNEIWFSYLRLPLLACGYIVIAEKPQRTAPKD